MVMVLMVGGGLQPGQVINLLGLKLTNGHIALSMGSLKCSGSLNLPACFLIVEETKVVFVVHSCVR